MRKKDRQIFRCGHYHPFVFSILQIGVKRQTQKIFPTRNPIMDIRLNRITTYKLTLWQNLSYPDIIVELLWRSQNPQIPGRKSYPSTAPFPHSSFKGVFMKPLHNPFDFNKSPLEFDNLRFLSESMMGTWGKLLERIFTSRSWSTQGGPFFSFFVCLFVSFCYCCYFQRHFIVSLKSSGWRQRAALQTLWGSKNDCWQNFLS